MLDNNCYYYWRLERMQLLERVILLEVSFIVLQNFYQIKIVTLVVTINLGCDGTRSWCIRHFLGWLTRNYQKIHSTIFWQIMLLYFSSSMKYKLILNFNECLKHLNSLLRVIRVNETTYQGKNYVFAIFGFL